MKAPSFLAETYEQMLREQLPNLFRLYLNPHVVKTCVCLDRYVRESWPTAVEPFQTFLANSFDEALSGAIKLARYTVSSRADVRGRPISASGLIVDPDGVLGPFVSAPLANGRAEFVPGLVVVGKGDVAPTDRSFDFVVLMPGASERFPQRIADIARVPQTLVVACVSRQTVAAGNRAWTPDIVVFDESFVRKEAPFGAFAARKSIYDYWNTAGTSTFHSTTFQPNTIASLHFMRCLEKDDGAFYAKVANELRQIDIHVRLRKKLFGRLYSPSLAKAIAMTGFETANVQASGNYVSADGRRVFDAVGGVACSVRGHNPPVYAAEIDGLAQVDTEAELADRLRNLTGLECMLPAVSGGSAVETALKIGLVAQFPRRHVIALKSGFGGKTLFALTGTWNSSYKKHIDPLYADVTYVDPFAPDAIAQIDAALAAHEVAVVQAELIQGVGGVRRVPEGVIRHLASSRARHGYLLLIDEVQTGMHRTGPFTLSRSMELTPDLLVVGKAISDMMFPFALVLYSVAVQQKLDQHGSDLPATFRKRHGYALGYQTALNVLRFAESSRLAERVADAGATFERLLAEALAGCTAVREVRVYGLLIGIELDDVRWPQRWFKKRLFWLYLSAMLKHPRFPVLVGFCQYEPNVLKITPPLTVDADEIRQMCATIGEVVRRPFYQLMTSALGGLLRSFTRWRSNHARVVQSAHEPVLRRVQ